MKEEEKSSHPQPSSQKIEISVSDPEARKQYGGAKQYHIYALKGVDNKGTIDLHRRYSDFDIFRSTLVKRWPGFYIPSLPSKLKITHSDEEFLELRSKYLQKFLKYLSGIEHIWYSEETQFFLKNKEMSCEKVLVSYSKIDFGELFYRYKTTFVGLEEKEEDLSPTIQQFDKFLKSLFVNIQEFRNKSEQNNKVQTKYQSRYSKFLLHLLERYEKKCLRSQTQEKEGEEDKKEEQIGVKVINQTACLTKKEELQEYMKECSSKILFQELKRQKRQILAFQQALREREQYIKKRDKILQKIKNHEEKIAQLVEGKKSFMSKIRGVSSESQISDQENFLEKCKIELEENNYLCKLIDLVMNKEIRIFKQDRITSYYDMVKDLMRSELELIEKEKEFWKMVISHNEFNYQMEEALKIQKSVDPLKKEQEEQQEVANERNQPQEKKKSQPQDKEKSERQGKEMSQPQGKEKSERQGKEMSQPQGKEKSERQGKEMSQPQDKDSKKQIEQFEKKGAPAQVKQNHKDHYQTAKEQDIKPKQSQQEQQQNNFQDVESDKDDKKSHSSEEEEVKSEEDEDKIQQKQTESQFRGG